MKRGGFDVSNHNQRRYGASVGEASAPAAWPVGDRLNAILTAATGENGHR